MDARDRRADAGRAQVNQKRFGGCGLTLNPGEDLIYLARGRIFDEGRMTEFCRKLLSKMTVCRSRRQRSASRRHRPAGYAPGLPAALPSPALPGGPGACGSAAARNRSSALVRMG